MHILVFDARLGFLFLHGDGFVETVELAEVEYEDVFRGVEAFLFDLPVDGVLAAVDGFILVVHDSSGAACRVISEISCKPGDGRNDDDDPEFAVCFGGADDSVYDRSADLVVDG